MTEIRPVSDLRNKYSEVEALVAMSKAPVFLTKNGRGAYAIVDIKEQEEYEKTKAALALFTELARGKKSGEEHGWISEEDVAAHFEARFKKA